ncbi:hypothetical protein PR048_016327 [Dryococelus australis]|uniref:Tc1-like transposase DDE domain-containing protein n=1 Tax=Dryococelus australis TaxID=614101 RepID=A0ABQ9HJV8_9NEOP|nr:hypothetical protein PR048_016327 [Dryococelus australis]
MDVLVWSHQNNIAMTEDLTKKELVEIVKRHKSQPVYTMDKMLIDRSFSVLVLPPYHCDLNSIELIWNIVKQKISASDVSKLSLSIMKQPTHCRLSEVTPGDWKKACQHVRNIEQEYWQGEELMEQEIEIIVINTGLESSDDESDQEIYVATASEPEGYTTDTTDKSTNMADECPLHTIC